MIAPSILFARFFRPEWSKRNTIFAVILAVLIIISFLQVATWKNSAKLFEHCLKINPDSWLSHNNLGNQLLDRGDKVAAAYHFKKAIEINPNFLPPYVNLGTIEEEKGNDVQALEYYLHVNKALPDEARTLNNIGNIYQRMGKNEEALEFYQKARMYAPQFSAQINYNIGLIYIESGDYTRAISVLHESLRANPSFRPSLELLEEIKSEQ
jgi:tetratricopeptide (TPR) repeat protein